MTDGTNQQRDLEAIRTAHQARAILNVLVQYRAANERILGEWLQRLGLTASRCDLSILLDRLEDAGLIRTESVERTRVVELRQPGAEVAVGTVRLDWIAAPELPE